ETCITNLAALMTTQGPFPADQAGNENTSGPRSRPYDWVLSSPSLTAKQVPVVIGQNQFANGLVFDSRVYTPLADVAPIMMQDSAATNMQHMPVVRDFALQ